MGYTLSGVQDQRDNLDRKQGGKGLFGRILGPLSEEKAEAKVE
jgi:hypothetical protein